MYPFILKLIEIFKTKKKVFEELKNSVKEVRKIVKEPASVYLESEQEVILKHKPFHEDTGLLPLVNSLMKANDGLVHYQDDEDKVSIRDKFGINMSKNLAHCGLDVHKAYLNMLQYVDKEQYFLEKWFKPVFEEMSKREDYREAWTESLSHFDNFLIILHMSIELFYDLLHLLKEKGFLGETIEARNKNRIVVKNNFVRAIEASDFEPARSLIKYAKNKGWFSKEEIEVLNNLVLFIEQKDAYQFERVIGSKVFKKIFNEEQEREFFHSIVIGKEDQLAKNEEELEALVKTASSLVGNESEILTLKPTMMKGRRVWVIDKDAVYARLEKELPTLITLIRQIKKVQIRLTSKQYKIRTKNVKKYLISVFQRIKNSKKALQKLLTKIDLRRRSRKFLISSMLVPILLGAIPKGISPDHFRFRLKPDAEIVRQVLPKATNEEISEMTRASQFVDGLVAIMKENKTGDINYEELPDYLKELISDGILDIAVFVGAEVGGFVPLKKDEIRLVRFAQNKLVLRMRYVDNIEKAKEAFFESDVIHVEAHSRYGLGWALAAMGMANPLRMAQGPVKIPKHELYGYTGKVLKDLGNGYVIVQASDEDIRQIKPRRGYQLISIGSCNSMQHFSEVIRRLREGLPTTVIYSTAEICGLHARTFLNGLLTGKTIQKIVDDMNKFEIRIDRLANEPIIPRQFVPVVLNLGADSPKNKEYDRYNISNSFTIFYDIEI